MHVLFVRVYVFCVFMCLCLRLHVRARVFVFVCVCVVLHGLQGHQPMEGVLQNVLYLVVVEVTVTDTHRLMSPQI